MFLPRCVSHPRPPTASHHSHPRPPNSTTHRKAQKGGGNRLTGGVGRSGSRSEAATIRSEPFRPFFFFAASAGCCVASSQRSALAAAGMAPPSTFDANLLEGYIDQLRRGEVLPESVVRSLCEKVSQPVVCGWNIGDDDLAVREQARAVPLLPGPRWACCVDRRIDCGTLAASMLRERLLV